MELALDLADGIPEPFDPFEEPIAVDDNPNPSIQYEGGTIRYYKRDRRFEATCTNEDHQTLVGHKCRLTITMPEPNGGDQSQARCLGRMGAWLEDQFDPAMVIGADHKNKHYVRSITHGRRKNSRQQMKLIAGFAELTAFEPAVGLGVDSEPE